MSVCHACGSVHVPGERFCRKCGERSRAFSVVWTVSGAFLMMALSGLAIAIVYRAGMLEGSRPLTLEAAGDGAKLMVAGALAVAFLLGGIVIGRASEGRTIVEAGLAATIAIGMLVGYAMQRDLDLGALRLAIVVAVPTSFALALFGAWLGERWQGSRPVRE